MLYNNHRNNKSIITLNIGILSTCINGKGIVGKGADTLKGSRSSK